MNVTGTPFTCLHPNYVVNPYTHQKIAAYCGECAACVARKARRYETQIQLEAQNSAAVLFVTLTYANSYVPKMELVPVTEELAYSNTVYHVMESDTGEVFDTLSLRSSDVKRLQSKAFLFGKIPYLDKKAIQKFMKRLRKSLSEYNNEKIRYFLCGEYGPKHFRPHFHLLLFLKSRVFLTPTRKTLAKDFPAWTWEHSENAVPDAPLSVLECAVRESWRFGSIDAVVPKGDCAQYVASYVNGLGNLPAVLRLSQTKPFTCHSRFLGFEFCKDEREKVYASTPEQIVHRSLSLPGFYKEFDCPVSYTNVFFPKCKGYALKTHRERLFTYRLYLAVRQEFPDLPLMTVAMDLVNLTMFYCSDVEGDTFPSAFPPLTALLCKYFKKSLQLKDRPFTEYTYEDKDTAIASVYRELCMSRHFLTFCCNGDYTQRATELYVRKIEDFYNYLERMKLARWYEEQQVYFDKDYVLDEDMIFFYDNVNIDPEEIKNSIAYQKYEIQCSDKARKLIKHKLQNDLNGIFNNV